MPAEADAAYDEAMQDGTMELQKQEIEQDQKAEEAKMEAEEKVFDARPYTSGHHRKTKARTPKQVWEDTVTEFAGELGRDLTKAIDGLQTVFQNQTASEADRKVSDVTNGVGFTKFDAEILTSFANQHKRKGWLSPKQQTILFKRIPKYAAQILRTKSAKVANA